MGVPLLNVVAKPPGLGDPDRIRRPGNVMNTHGPRPGIRGDRRNGIRRTVAVREIPRCAVRASEKGSEEPLARGSDEHWEPCREKPGQGVQQQAA